MKDFAIPKRVMLWKHGKDGSTTETDMSIAEVRGLMQLTVD